MASKLHLVNNLLAKAAVERGNEKAKKEKEEKRWLRSSQLARASSASRTDFLVL